MGEPLLSPDPQPGWRESKALAEDAFADVYARALELILEVEAVAEENGDQKGLVESRGYMGYLKLKRAEYAGAARELRAQQADRPGRTDHRPVTTRRLRAAPPDRPGGAS